MTGRHPLTSIYEALLRLYPASYRNDWGSRMSTTFDQRVAELRGAGLWRRARFAARELGNLLLTAAREHLGGGGDSVRGGAGGFSRSGSDPGPPHSSPRSPRREIMSDWLFDVRVALRGWRRSPGTTAVIIVTLALGIGATTAIFSVVHGVVLAPLPFPEAAALVRLSELLPEGGSSTLSMPDFADFREQSTTLDGVAVYDGNSVTLTGDGDPERLSGRAVSAGFFEMLGLEMTLGRSFGFQDEAEGAPRVVILGHGLWRERFAAATDVLGETLRIDDLEHTIIGVAPAGISFGDTEPQVWLPFRLTRSGMDNRGGHMYEVIARLADDTALETARQEVAAIGRGIAEATPDYHEGGRSATLIPLKETIVGEVDDTLFLLLGAVGLLLMIACVNVASIMLARAESRGREVAVRAALGAGKARLARPLLADSLLLALTGGVAGVALAHFGGRAILDTLAGSLPRAVDVGTDWRVLGFAFAVTAGVGLLVGLLPMWQVLRADTYAAMRSGSGQQAGSRGASAMRRVLIVAEIGLAVMLVLGAGLLVRSLLKLQGVERGFVSEGALTFRVSMPGSRYPTMAEAGEFIRTLETELQGLPSVEAAGAIGLLPFFSSQYTGIAITGADPDLTETTQFRYATPGYFDAIGTRIVRGRGFSERDTPDTPPVIVLSRTLADRLFGNTDPLGRHVYIPGWGGPEAIEVVGIVEDVKLSGLRDDAPPAMYWPYAQWNSRSSMSFVVRSDVGAATLIPQIREIVRRLDADLPVYSIEALADRTRRSVAEERLTTWLLSGFAALALLLGAVGIFGVMAYSVVQRRQEIGVRMALGAGPVEVVRSVLKEATLLTAGGLALGAIGALALGRALRSLLYQTTPSDPATFAAVAVLLISVALLACLLPARRAANVDPMVVLRND